MSETPSTTNGTVGGTNEKNSGTINGTISGTINGTPSGEGAPFQTPSEQAKVPQKLPMEERIRKFKELIKQGYTKKQARQESGISGRLYTKMYDSIWSDPELQPFKHERRKKRKENEETVEDSIKRLQDYAEAHKTEFEKRYDELQREQMAIVTAAAKILEQFMRTSGALPRYSPPPPVAPPPAPAAGPGPTAPTPPEPPKNPIDEFEEAVKKYEETRTKMKETLEKLGYKVEDTYMRKDEVEKLVQEVRQKAEEEALDDKRIDAVERIITAAVDKIVGAFQPAIQAIFGSPAGAAQTGTEGGVGPSKPLEGASGSQGSSA